MNARAVTSDMLLGLVPIALVIAVWQALVSFGYAPVTLLPPPGRVFARLAAATLTTRRSSRRSPPRCSGCSPDSRSR